MGNKLKRVAYLGPAGTHTEIALRQFVSVESPVACFSVGEVFRLLASHKVDAGFVPIENLIQGTVTETLDSLLAYRNQVYIVNSHLMPIRNALGVLPEKVCGKAWPREITAILSHEQPLRQCSRYLSDHFPDAARNPCPSTAAAIQQVKEQSLAGAAVIGAKDSLLEHGYQILEEDISDFAENKTRFVLLQAGDIETLLPKLALPSKNDRLGEGYVTSIILDPKRDRQGLLVEVLQVISVQHHINLVTIHSRPDAKGGFVFYFDLEGHPREPRIENCIQSLRQFCVDTTGEKIEISLLGLYPRNAFYGLPFRSVGIVGGEGKMGKWLAEFFRTVGLQVNISDLSSALRNTDLVAQSDVVILSVPMHIAREIAADILPNLRAGQLVVENCSVKSCLLPLLEETAPADVEVLGIHTMFGGDVPTLRGENVIITRTNRSGELAKAFEDLLYKYGARISYSSVSEHDHVSAALQSLMQLNLICLGEVLGQEFKTIEELEVFSTPNSRAMTQAVARVLQQSEELIVDLQIQNKDAIALRHRFLETLCRIISGLNHNDLSALREAIARGRSFLGS